MALSGTTLQLTDAGGTLSQDLSSLQDGTADADADPTNELNTTLALSGTTLQLTDAGGTLSQDLASLQDGTVDADADPTNELITSALLDSNVILELVEAGTVTNLVDLANLLNSTLVLSGTTLQLTDGGGVLSVDLASIQDGVDDADADPTNELNTTLGLSGTTLQLTDAGGTLSQDLASLQDGTIDADADPTNELITSLALTASNVLEIIEAGVTHSVDLSSVASETVTSLYDNFGWTGSSGVQGTGPSGLNEEKILELVEATTSNRFEVDFNRIQPGNIITGLPFTISESGFYYIIDNLTNTAVNGDGIIIDANEVTLDLMGYTLYGGKVSGINSDDGIFVLGSQENITIRNGSVVGWNGDGINALNADHSIFHDLHVAENDGDGLVGDFNCLMVRITAASNGLDGVEGDDGTVILHSTAASNGDNGIQSSEGCVVAHSASFDNETDGIDVAAGSVVAASSATDNGVFGFDMALGSQVTDSVAYDNVSNGFDMASACIMNRNISSLNNGHGVRTFANSFIRNSKFHENDLDGIRISSTDSYVDGNNTTDNDQTGIAATSSGSLITRNFCAGNITNYNINASSAFGPILDVTGVGDLAAVTNSFHPWANFSY